MNDATEVPVLVVFLGRLQQFSRPLQAHFATNNIRTTLTEQHQPNYIKQNPNSNKNQTA